MSDSLTVDVIEQPIIVSINPTVIDLTVGPAPVIQVEVGTAAPLQVEVHQTEVVTVEVNQGPAGVPGSTWYFGTGAPTTIHNDGDLDRQGASGTGVDHMSDTVQVLAEQVIDVAPPPVLVINGGPPEIIQVEVQQGPILVEVEEAQLITIELNQGPAGPSGPAGTSPAVSMSGDQIAVNGVVTGPHLTGPQGSAGSPGAAGSVWHISTGAPSTTYANGDCYLDMATGYVYLQVAGAWVQQTGTLQGPQGIQGIQGLQGIQGQTGQTGATGATGAAGPNQVTTATATTLAGTLRGNGSVVSALADPSPSPAGTYGDGSHYAVVTVDVYGRVTSASSQGVPAGGVSSFNTRAGAVTLTSSDVTTALGDANIAYTDVANTFTLQQTFQTAPTSPGSGQFSEQWGKGASATGRFSSAFGYGSSATASGAYASGHGATASATNAMATGPNCLAASGSAVAVGSQAQIDANSSSSTILGLGTITNSPDALAMGYNTITSSPYSVGVGVTTITNSTGVVVIGGTGSAVSANYAVCLGYAVKGTVANELTLSPYLQQIGFYGLDSLSHAKCQGLILNSFVNSTEATYTGRIDAAATDWTGTARIGFSVSTDGTQPLISFYGGTPAAKPTITGSRGGNAALASLLTALAGLGLLTDSTT